MMLFVRIVAGLVGVAAAALALRRVSKAGADPIAMIIQATLVTAALFFFWLAAFGHLASEREKLARTLLIGLAAGAVAFAAGFFGPLIFTPEANQGPLLGIFITGPAGFILGCVGGFFCTRFARRTA